MKILHFGRYEDGKPYSNIDIENGGILEIAYTTETGRGTFKFDLVRFFPATIHDVKVLIDMLWRSPDTYTHARTIADYLNKVIEDLQDLRRENPYNDQDKKDNAKITGYIKRYISNLDKFAQAFGIESVTDCGVQASKMSKCDVVCVEYNNGKKEAKTYSGKQFTKNGLVFEVVQKKKGGARYIIIPGTGASCASYTGAEKEAPEHIDARLLECFENMRNQNPDSFDHMHCDFVKICEENEMDAPALPECWKAPTQETAPECSAVSQMETKKDTATPAQVWKPCTMTARRVYGIIYLETMRKQRAGNVAKIDRAKCPKKAFKIDIHINLYPARKNGYMGKIQSHNATCKPWIYPPSATPGSTQNRARTGQKCRIPQVTIRGSPTKSRFLNQKNRRSLTENGYSFNQKLTATKTVYPGGGGTKKRYF